MIPSVPAQRYMKNPHVTMNAIEKDGRFHLKYDFRDHKNKLNRFNFVFRLDDMRRMADKYRFPRNLMSSGMLTAQQMQRWKQKREQALEDGMFKLKGNMLIPDYDAIVSYYAPTFCAPAAQQIISALQHYGTDTRRDRIEMAMKFVQDIPYGIPAYNDPDYMYGGIITPPQIMYYQYGDCDSKSMLFAGILSSLIPPEEVSFLLAPNHLFVGIKELRPETGMAHANVNGSQYVFAETAGPARYNYGQASELNQGRLEFFPLTYRAYGSMQPYTNESTSSYQSEIEVPPMPSNIPEPVKMPSPEDYRFEEAPKSAPLNGFVAALREVSQDSEAIKSIIFNDRGGWAILSDENSVVVSDVPEKMVEDMQKVLEVDAVITDLAIADDDRYVVVYYKGYGFAGNIEESGQLFEVLNGITEKHGLPVSEVEFIRNEVGGGWVVLYGKNGDGYVCSASNKEVENALNADLAEAAKSGIRSIAFAQQNGWVVLYGKNSVMMRLSEDVAGDLSATLDRLQANDAQIDRIYFTATNDWVVIFNGNEFTTSIYEEGGFV